MDEEQQKPSKYKKNKLAIDAVKQDVVFIPNRITNARYDYGLHQERILNYILYTLQSVVKASMNGNDWQLPLEFDPENRCSIIRVQIPLNKLTTHQQYGDFRAAAVEMGKTAISISTPLKEGGTRVRTVYLFCAIDSWNGNERENMLTVEMTHEVAALLVEIDQNRHGQPMNYTSFLLQVALRAKNKYTPRIYKFISSWREKGGTVVELSKFREMLGIGSKYPKYAEFKRNVLIPAQQELFERADCWFNCAQHDFEDREGREVVRLRFKVITPGTEQLKARQADLARGYLIQSLGFKPEHLTAVDSIFQTNFDYGRLIDEIHRLDQYIAQNKRKIGNKQAYVISVLMRVFCKE